MADLEELVSGIDIKVHRLIERLNILRQENEKNKNEIHELNLIKEKQNQTIETLSKNINNLRSTRNIEFKGGTVEAKVTINELLREIDKCIGLLNR